MSLSIKLDHPNAHVWSPGEKITGKVKLTLDKDDEVESITIKFRGKISTEIAEGNDMGDTHRHFVYLFDQNIMLFKGPYTLPAREHEWPFEFIFPKSTNYDVSKEFSTNKTTYNLGPQNLPPTLIDDGFDSSCSIIYKLKAEVPRTVHPLTAEQHLIFTPLRVVDEPEPNQKVMAGEHFQKKYRVGPDSMPRLLTTRERMHDKMHGKSDSTVLKFRVQLQVATSVIAGQRVPLTLQIISQPIDGVVPQLFLTEISGCLKAHTFIRAPGSFIDHEGFIDTDIEVGGKLNIKVPIPLDIPIAVDDIWPLTIKRGSPYIISQLAPIPPTLSTYTVRRVYIWKFHVKVLCIDEIFDTKIVIPDVKVYPPYTASTAPRNL